MISFPILRCNLWGFGKSIQRLGFRFAYWDFRFALWYFRFGFRDKFLLGFAFPPLLGLTVRRKGNVYVVHVCFSFRFLFLMSYVCFIVCLLLGLLYLLIYKKVIALIKYVVF